MTAENRLLILQRVQELTEEAVVLGSLVHEDSKDSRPVDKRGSTHEMRIDQERRVRKIRAQIEQLLAE